MVDQSRGSLYSSRSLPCFSKKGKGLLGIFQVLDWFPSIFFMTISEPFDEVVSPLLSFPNVEYGFYFVDDRVIAVDNGRWLDN